MNAPHDAPRTHRYLFATVPAAGHVHPAVPIARALVARGHQVRWLTGTAYRELVTLTGADFEPLVEAFDPAEGTSFTERFPEREGLSGLTGLKFDLKHVFLDEIPGQFADLQRVLATYPADVIVTDAGFMGASVQHEVSGTPWASIGITPLAMPSRDLAPFGTGLPPVRTVRDRLRATAMSLIQRVVLRDVESHHTAIRAGYGLPASQVGVFGAGASPQLYLQSGTEAFDYPRSDLPPQVHYVGPLTSSGAPSSTHTDWKALAAGRPIIVLTQGTVADRADTLVDPGLRALADEDVFVVAVGTSLSGEPPANARHVPYLPYDEILPLASAMVTNGGYGGVQIALSHGVPLAVAGATEDKPEVAARVAWTGAGINLRTATPTQEAVRDAVRRLLTDHDIRRSAQRIAEDYARHDAPETAADLIETHVDPGSTDSLRRNPAQQTESRTGSGSTR
jgi:MGT family glycosyltransferase